MQLAAEMGNRERMTSRDSGLARTMHYVDIPIKNVDIFTMPIDEFSARYIMQAINDLAGRVLKHDGPVTFCRILNATCEAYDGVCVGVVKSYDIKNDADYLRVGVAVV
jgi:hypothetical protein